MSRGRDVVADFSTSNAAARYYERLIRIGIALSAEQDHDRLMERILVEAMRIPHADGGTLYRRNAGNELEFAIMRTDSLGLAFGGTTGRCIKDALDLGPLWMYDPKTGAPNRSNVATLAALTGQTVEVPDLDGPPGRQFSGTRVFDERLGYHSNALLAVPLKNREGRVIGVLELINPIHPDTGERTSFAPDMIAVIEVLASQAAVTLDNRLLQETSKARYERLIRIGTDLSRERNHDRLMENILLEAKHLCNADGGTLYLRTENNELKFEIMRTDSKGFAAGGTTGTPIAIPPLRMYDAATGEPNHKNIASHAALSGGIVNIPDAYEARDFDFSGTKRFDEKNQYRSKSFLTVPLKDHEGDVIGVLQLLNAIDPDTKQVVPFDPGLHGVIEALASQAAVALDNQQLIAAQRKLLDSFIELIASAIDAKSPYTGGHCQRVPALTTMLADEASSSTDPRFADFRLDEDGKYEIHIAALLHDCGKVTTPEYVVDKATKLEAIYNRIHEIRTRFEVVKRDAEITYLRGVVAGGDEAELRAERDRRLAQLDEDFTFVAECNLGGEFMAPEKIERVKRIAEVCWQRTLDDRLGLSQDEMLRKEKTPVCALPAEESLLADRPDHIVARGPSDLLPADDSWGFRLQMPSAKYNLGEVYNLCVARGTLTAEERYKINDHVVQTIMMLAQLPFPKHLRQVPEIAGGHHETMVGSGYPRRLTREQMSIPGPDRGDRRHLRGADGFGPPLQETEDAGRKPAHHVVHAQRRPHRSRSFRIVRPLRPSAPLCRGLPAPRAGRRVRYRSPVQTPAVKPCSRLRRPRSICVGDARPSRMLQSSPWQTEARTWGTTIPGSYWSSGSSRARDRPTISWSMRRRSASTACGSGGSSG